MSLESALDEYPKEIRLRDGLNVRMRPLEPDDHAAFHRFFTALPAPELLYIKHRVTEAEVVRAWCESIDLGRNLPLLAWDGDNIIGVCTLHQSLGGWKRHIGRVSVHVHPLFRGRGLAQAMVAEIVNVARACSLEKLEAEFIGTQNGAIKVFGLIGFGELARIPAYVKDMQAITHDYVLMGLDLLTDDEFAGMG
ncbi:MAG: GNAT family N-acetyltransferase [Proteobacteria bacterium]|nr:GNAT family N-acetyltransferase [Pseudomonadota bacterium]